MNKMYAVVLFLLAIASSISATTCTNNDDKKIAMVVQPTTLKTVEEADIPLQVGRFKVKDGKSLTLLRPATPNCVGLDADCAWYSAWCCEGLHCGDDYKCVRDTECTAQGGGCALISPPCCWPYWCDAASNGHCVPRPDL